MSEPRHTARAIVIHNDQLLLMERWWEDRHYFSFPGGGIEPDETPEQTVVREVLEETTCEIAVRRELYIFRSSGAEHHIFLCDYTSGEPHLPADAPEAAEGSTNRFEPKWLPLQELAQSPVFVWEPIQRQLLRDLAAGFAEKVVEITAD